MIRDSKLIKRDLEQAQRANVPNVELLIQRCTNCIDRMNDISEEYIKKGK